MRNLLPFRLLCLVASAVILASSAYRNLLVDNRFLLVLGEGLGNLDIPRTFGLPEVSSSSRENTGPSRMLLGIFTTATTEEQARRKLIRNTYLSYYTMLAEADLGNEPTNRLCSLQSLLQQRSSGESAKVCLIVYTFVMGAFDPSNTTAPTDLQGGNEIPFTVSRPRGIGGEGDVTYLNIRENMNRGKTETWFRYASSILPADDLGIDLIAKADSDSILIPGEFLKDLDSGLKTLQLQRPAQNIYGGYAQVQRKIHDVPYMQGGFYFLSTDVARAVCSDACPRTDIIEQTSTTNGWGRSEDREIGNFIENCWNIPRSNQGMAKIQALLVSPRMSVDHRQSLKEPQNFRVQWKNRFSTDAALLRSREVKAKYTLHGGCPPSKAIALDELKWFDKRPNMQQAKQKFSRILKKACAPGLLE